MTSSDPSDETERITSDEPSRHTADESPESSTIIDGLDGHFFGDGTIASARTREDVAILALCTKPIEDARDRHGVYTLLCRSPYQTEEAAISRALKFESSLSESRIDALKEAIDAPVVFYVGQSRDVVERLYNHSAGRGGFMTSLFPPRRLVSIDWYHTEREARRAERERAKEMERDHPAAYIAGGR